MRQVYLKFYGSHRIDFAAQKRDALKFAITTEMRELDIPNFDGILLSAYDDLAKYSQSFNEIAQNIDTWTPLSFPGMSIPPERQNIVLIGPLGIHIWFTPHHIAFSPPLSERAAWYALENREEVNHWRKFFQTIITHFGGDRIIYLTELQANKYYTLSKTDPQSSVPGLAAALIERYGANKKQLFTDIGAQHPRYFIDEFQDLNSAGQ